jgi:hypothetical protein
VEYFPAKVLLDKLRGDYMQPMTHLVPWSLQGFGGMEYN